MSNAGRPKKDGLDKVIKVTVSENVANILNSAAIELGKTKADILRELIPTISSREFESSLSITNMEILQKYSDDCWDLLHNAECIFETENLSERIPAFLVAWCGMLYVKFPTYRIQIFDSEDPAKRTEQKTLEQLLKQVKNKSMIALAKTDYLMIGNEIEKLSFPYINETVCMERSMKENIECKDRIVSILKESGYDTAVTPTYYIRGIQIELLDDGKYFKVKKRQNKL